VQADWDVKPDETFPVRLVVYGQDRQSLLADLAKAIAETRVNIRSAGVASEDKTARGVFVVEVQNLARLRDVIGAIRSVPGVTRAERRQRITRAPGRRAGGGR